MRHRPSFRLRSRALLASATLVLAAAAGVWVACEARAQGPDEPPTWAYRLPHDLMSPFCPGRTLAECPSPQADELRLWILTQAAAGASREEVEASLLARFGDQILSAPRAEGWGLAAYVLPFAAFVLGGLFVFWALRRLAAREPTAADRPAVPAAGGPPKAPVADAELERLLDEELSRG